MNSIKIYILNQFPRARTFSEDSEGLVAENGSRFKQVLAMKVQFTVANKDWSRKLVVATEFISGTCNSRNKVVAIKSWFMV